MELQGIYLRAMQDISARLMEALPAEDALWQTLTQTESLLIEAQLAGASLHDVFGSGGVAAFCQSIVDEYNRERAGQPRDIPAAADPALRHAKEKHEPRGGINYHRKRRATAALIVAFSLLFVLLATWYTGILNFLVKGSAYYLDELYNFNSTVVPSSPDPISFTLPLTETVDIDRILYVDAEGRSLTLTALSSKEWFQDIPTAETGENGEGQIHQKSYLWYIRIRYPVDAGYLSVQYTEPGKGGHATVSLPSGEILTLSLSTLNAGSDGRGYEYVELEVADIPASVVTDGAMLSVTLSSPQTVTWERIGTGFRS